MVDDDADAARDAARPALEWIGDPDWDVHIAPLPFADEFRALRAGASGRAERSSRRCPTRGSTSSPSSAPWTTPARRIGQLHDAGVTTTVLMPVGPDPLAALEDLARVL